MLLRHHLSSPSSFESSLENTRKGRRNGPVTFPGLLVLYAKGAHPPALTSIEISGWRLGRRKYR
jgi:hypothetical protein